MNETKLQNFDRGVSSADKFLDVISDPRKAIAIVIIVLLIIGLLWFFKSQISNLFSGIKTRINQQQVSNEIEQTYGSATLTSSQVITLADNVHSCFGTWFGDNEDQLYIYLSQINNQADYELLKKTYGNRKCPKLSCSTLHDLEGVINCNLDSSERQHIKSILASKGIYNTLIND